MSIFVFGSLNIDRTFRLPHFLEVGETIKSADVKVHAGGKGANQAVALAKAGAVVHMAGTVGRDGSWIPPLLNGMGVDVSLVRIKDDKQTGTADILVDAKGRNGIVVFGGGNQANDKEYVNMVFRQLHPGDWVVFENEINNINYMYQKAITGKVKICFNPSPFEGALEKLPLKSTSLLVVNEVEGTALAMRNGSYKDILKGLTAKYPQTEIIMTLGDQGSLYGYEETTYYCPPLAVSVRDTTAAGDTFLGYYLAMRENGFGIKEAMAIATQASSIAVSRSGSMESIPDIAELKLEIKKNIMS